MNAAHFELYDDALPALEELRAHGLEARPALELVPRSRRVRRPPRPRRRRGADLLLRTGRRSRTSRSSGPCSTCSTSSPHEAIDDRRHASRTTSRGRARSGCARCCSTARAGYPEVEGRLVDLRGLPRALGSGIGSTPVRRTNVFSPEFDHGSERDGYRWRGLRVGKAVGASRSADPSTSFRTGSETYPFHFHHGMEEWLLVVAGTPTLRGAARRACASYRRPGLLPARARGRAPGARAGHGADRSRPTARPRRSSTRTAARSASARPARSSGAADSVDYWDGE